MIVAELIKELEKMPQDKQAYIDGMVSIANAVFYAEEKDYVMIID